MFMLQTQGVSKLVDDQTFLESKYIGMHAATILPFPVIINTHDLGYSAYILHIYSLLDVLTKTKENTQANYCNPCCAPRVNNNTQFPFCACDTTVQQVIFVWWKFS